jgi:putative DNA primase/helicase
MERFFTRNALDFDFDPDAPAPVEWLKFLRSLRKDDAEVALLQEIFGYLIVPDTSQQKIFMLYGPRRSGKGTIAKVLGQLVGRHNTAGPSFKSLDRDFGLAALVGKQLALVSDMRVGRQTDKAALTENLLRISGEDVVTIDRKYKSSWTGHLAVRFLILTNKLPSIPDDSGALASRFVPLAMTESFLGREDVGLFDKLKPELPGVLLWSIEGWRRLRERGHFDLPTASRDLADRIHTGGSPITAFLNERFTFDAKASTPKNKIWQAWGSWCQSHGVFAGDTSQFGQGLIEAGQGRISAHKPVIEGGQVPSYRGLKFADEPPAQEKIPF